MIRALGICGQIVSNCHACTRLALDRCKRECKPSRSRRCGAGRPVTLRRGFRGEGKGRKGFERSGHVEKLRVGVDVRREARVGMPHGGLGRPQGDAPLAQERSERRPQGMDVERAATIVTLGDAGESDVSVRRSRTQTGGDREDRRVGRKACRDRLALAALALSWSVASLSASQDRRSAARSSRMTTPLPSRLFSSAAYRAPHGKSARRDGVARPSGNRVRPCGAPSGPGSYRSKTSLPTDLIELITNLIADVGGELTAIRPATNGHRVDERATPCHVEQLHEFRLGHRPTLASGVRRLIRLTQEVP